MNHFLLQLYFFISLYLNIAIFYSRVVGVWFLNLLKKRFINRNLLIVEIFSSKS